jgi:hypothetical protein
VGNGSRKPRSITVTGNHRTFVLENVLVGDVWLLGGQSNMKFPLERVENGQLEIVSANYPEERHEGGDGMAGAMGWQGCGQGCRTARATASRA